MMTLGSSLHANSISSSKLSELFMLRDQTRGTLPDAEGVSQTRFTKSELSAEDQRRVAELQQIDRNVREHEAAHLRAGAGVVTSGATFTYTKGPDDKQYAVSGEVSIDTSSEREPRRNIDKGERIQIAALAPRDPSPQDHRVAAVGSQMEAQGRSDLVVQQREEVAEQSSEKEESVEKEKSVEKPSSADESERPLSSESPSARNERAPNAEPVPPSAEVSEATRQRISQAYASAEQATNAAFSLFA